MQGEAGLRRDVGIARARPALTSTGVATEASALRSSSQHEKGGLYDSAYPAHAARRSSRPQAAMSVCGACVTGLKAFKVLT